LVGFALAQLGNDSCVEEIHGSVYRSWHPAPQAPSPLYEGQSVTLSVWAEGTPTLTYQWTKNGVNLGGQTATNLVLNNLTTNSSARAGQSRACSPLDLGHNSERSSFKVLEDGHPLLGTLRVPVNHVRRVRELNSFAGQTLVGHFNILHAEIDH